MVFIPFNLGHQVSDSFTDLVRGLELFEAMFQLKLYHHIIKLGLSMKA